ncbi:MAG: endolytic transglycosylase MltG [Campylobacteraceae bacterium]|nr:endolytic transglycosylase MltG [Campylobacteraceae bacterium]
MRIPLYMTPIKIMNKSKKISIGSRILFFGLNLFLIAIVSLLFYLIQPIGTERIIHVPKGGINSIITQLAAQNGNISVGFDKLLMRFFGYPQSGWIDMKGALLTKADFLYQLSHAKAATRAVTLTPGETAYIFLKQLSSELNLSFEVLQREYEKMSRFEDGWIVPETYNIPIGVDEKWLVKYLINDSLKRNEALSYELTGEYDSGKWNRILTIASIIQKESADDDEMPIVSSVIHNRLKIRMKLQMDGTLNYGQFSHTKITPKRIKEDTSHYNTYAHYGLPQNPVCAVSKEAIKAAVNPVESEYLYFVKGENGKHLFTKTYNEHLKNISK